MSSVRTRDSHQDVLLSFFSISNFQKEKKIHTALARNKSLLDIMKEKKEKLIRKRIREESDDETSVSYTLHEQLQNKYILLKKKIKENEIQISEKDSTIKKLTDKNKEMSAELKTIRSLNLRLQEKLLSTPGFSFKFFIIIRLNECLSSWFLFSFFNNVVSYHIFLYYYSDPWGV